MQTNSNISKYEKIYLVLICLLLGLSQQVYADAKKKIPDEKYWERTNDRDNAGPVLYQDDSSVYVYSEKQLDNLYIGITDMMGNVVYEETTTVPACVYYAVSIESLPAGSYYISIIQGSKYVIGVFVKE